MIQSELFDADFQLPKLKFLVDLHKDQFFVLGTAELPASFEMRPTDS